MNVPTKLRRCNLNEKQKNTSHIQFLELASRRQMQFIFHGLLLTELRQQVVESAHQHMTDTYKGLSADSRCSESPIFAQCLLFSSLRNFEYFSLSITKSSSLPCVADLDLHNPAALTWICVDLCWKKKPHTSVPTRRFPHRVSGHHGFKLTNAGFSWSSLLTGTTWLTSLVAFTLSTAPKLIMC